MRVGEPADGVMALICIREPDSHLMEIGAYEKPGHGADEWSC